MAEFLSTPKQASPQVSGRTDRNYTALKIPKKLLLKSCQPVNFEYLATREEIRLMEEQKKLLTHTLGVVFPEPQLVRWGPKDDRPAGISINSATGFFIPWEELEDEIKKKLLIQIRIITSNSEVILDDFHGRKDWIVKVISPDGNCSSRFLS